MQLLKPAALPKAAILSSNSIVDFIEIIRDELYPDTPPNNWIENELRSILSTTFCYTNGDYAGMGAEKQVEFFGFMGKLREPIIALIKEVALRGFKEPHGFIVLNDAGDFYFQFKTE